MSIKYIKYLLTSSLIFRCYMLLREGNSRKVFFGEHYPDFSKEELQKVIKKSRIAWIKHQMKNSDFYQLHCEDKRISEIGEYLSLRESSLFCRLVNSAKVRMLLNNKYDCYKFFSNYYRRKVVLISQGDLERRDEMAKIETLIVNNQAQSYIIKPLKLNCGRGVKILTSKEEIGGYVHSIGGGIIEEVIVQDDSLAAFNKSSVNTLRINTANYGDNEIEVLWPCLRMGRSGSVVDNAGAGGIFAAIDVKTGKTTAAVDESRNVYRIHPDSMKELIGFTIPKWQEALCLVKELAKMIPDAGFVGWDLALTRNGWVMVEGNSCPLLIYQIAVGHGIRKEFHKMKKKFRNIRRYRD